MEPDMKAGQAIGMLFGGGVAAGIGGWLTYASWTGSISGSLNAVPLTVFAPLVVLAGAIILGIGIHGLVQLSRASARRPRTPTGPGLLIATVVLGVLGLGFAGKLVLTSAIVWFAGLVVPTVLNPLVWAALWCGFKDQVHNGRPTGWVALAVVVLSSVALTVVHNVFVLQGGSA